MIQKKEQADEGEKSHHKIHGSSLDTSGVRGRSTHDRNRSDSNDTSYILSSLKKNKHNRCSSDSSIKEAHKSRLSSED